VVVAVAAARHLRRRLRRHLGVRDDVRLALEPRAAHVHVPAGERALAVHLVALERDAVELVRLGELGAHLERAHDEALAEDLLEGLAVLLAELQLVEHRHHVLRLRVRRVVAGAQPRERHEGDAAGVLW